MQDHIRVSVKFQHKSALEHVINLVSSQIGPTPSTYSEIDPRWSFSSQILSIPFLWNHCPYLKEVILFFIYPFNVERYPFKEH